MLNDILYWVWLAELLSPGRARAVCERMGGPERAFFSDPALLDELPFLTRDQIAALKRRDLKRAEDIITRCERLDVRAVCLSDTEYPDRMRNMEQPPLVLYVRGKRLHLDSRAVIGMTGTRSASPYGRQLADAFARAIVRAGGVVATGIVSGCDAIAAQSAIAAGGPLVLVVPGGVDVSARDSTTNRDLLAAAPAVGCVISEQPPGTGITGPRFRRRNELLIGLSNGILCVEGGMDSGAVKTARMAAESGRDVFVPPANLTSPTARGSNALLSERLAHPVSRPEDLLSCYGPLLIPAHPPRTGTKQPRPPKAQTFPRRAAPPEQEPSAPAQTAPAAAKAPKADEKGVDTVSNTGYIELLEQDRAWSEQERAILSVLREGDTTAEALIARTGLGAADIGSAMVLLVVDGAVEELPGGRYRLHEKRRNSLRL